MALTSTRSLGPLTGRAGIVHHPDDRRGVGGHLLRDQRDRHRHQRPVHDEGRQRPPAEVAVESSATSPAGLGVADRRRFRSARRTRSTGVEGFQRELSRARTARSPPDGTPLQFAGWSDGKSIRHTITTPEDDTTYTATYGPRSRSPRSTTTTRPSPGTPVLTRQDPKINFAWGEGSPASRGARRQLLGRAGPRPSSSVPAGTSSPRSPTTGFGSTSTASG